MMQGSLAERLRVLRARQGLSLTEASKRAGITRDTLSDLERGKRHAYMPTLAKIAEGYDVDVEELLEEPVPAGKAEASETGPDIARSEALRQWERGHKAIARAIADAFGFSVADFMEEPSASLVEAPEAAGKRRAGAAAEPHLTIHSTLEDLEENQVREILAGVVDGRITVEEARQLVTEAS